MAALKAIVIIMGVLIFAGIAVIAFTIVGRSGGEPGKAEGFGTATLEGTAGCRIAETRTDGGRLVLRTEGPGPGCGRVHILNLDTGAQLGTVETGPAD